TSCQDYIRGVDRATRSHARRRVRRSSRLTTREDVVDQDERTTPAAGAEPQSGAGGSASRSQHTVYTLPHDWALIRRFLAPALERAQRLRADDASGPAVLVIASDTEGA